MNVQLRQRQFPVKYIQEWYILKTIERGVEEFLCKDGSWCQIHNLNDDLWRKLRESYICKSRREAIQLYKKYYPNKHKELIHKCF